MIDPVPNKPRAKTRNLIGILAFLRKYPGRVGASISLLLVNIGIEMTLPQILGNVITRLRDYITRGLEFDLWLYVQVFLALVLIRAGIGAK